MLAVLSVVLGIFAREAVALFRDNDPLALDIGARTLLYQCFTLPLMSWVVMSNMMLQTMGKVVPASLLAASRQGMCFLPAILLLPPLFGMTGVEIAQSVADVLSFALAIPITINVLKELSRPSPTRTPFCRASHNTNDNRKQTVNRIKQPSAEYYADVFYR